MSKPIAALLTAAAVTIGLMSHPGPAAAAPAANAYANVPAGNLEAVRYYGGGWRGGWGGWRGGGWRGGGWGYYGGGFAAGAILGGMLAAPYYYGGGPYYYGGGYADPGYYEDGGAPDGAVDYCIRRFRSYDLRSGTYLGNDGRRHPCP
jgi:BA14K-like protein